MRRLIVIFFLLGFMHYGKASTVSGNTTDSLTSGTLLSDLFGKSDQLQAGAQAEEQAAATQIAQYQKLFLSDSYEDTISLMSSSGVMDTFNGLVQRLQSGSDVSEDDINNVVNTLSSLLNSMIDAYVSAGLPIIATPSNAAYSFYTTVMLLYIARLRYLSTVVISTAQSGEDYSSAITVLFDAYSEYDLNLQTLADAFPISSSNTSLNDYYAKLSTLAIDDFYQQVSLYILPDMISAIEASMISSAAADDQATWALSAYNTLMSYTDLQTGYDSTLSSSSSYDVSFLNTKTLSLYDSFADYQVAFLNNLYAACESAVAYFAEEINFKNNPIVSTGSGVNPNEAYLANEYTMCTNMAAVFKDIDTLSSSYMQIVEWQSDVKKNIDAFDESLTLLASIQDNCTTAASDLQTMTKSTDLNGLISIIQSAASDCTTTINDLTLLGDATTLETVQAMQYSLSALYWLAYMKYYWSVFLEDTTVGGVALATVAQSFSTMNDANFATNLSNIADVMKVVVCLQSLNASCSASSINIQTIYNSGYDLTKFMSTVMDLTSADVTVSSTGATLYYDVATLQNIQTLNRYLANYGNAFIAVNDALQTVTADKLSSIKLLLAQVMLIAQQIDVLYASDSTLANYLPNLSATVMSDGSQTFVEMSAATIIYILGNIAEALDSNSKFVESAVCYALLMGYSTYLSDDDTSYIEGKIAEIGGNVELATEAANVVSAAASADWTTTNNITQNNVWLSGIQLYQFAYQLAANGTPVPTPNTDDVATLNVATQIKDPSDILKSYDQTIQDYITAYGTTVDDLQKNPLDLLYLYYLLLINYNATSNNDLGAITSDVSDIFQNTDATGFFDLLTSTLYSFKNETDIDKITAHKQTIEDLISEFRESTYAEANWLLESKLLFNETMNSMLSITDNSDGSTTCSFVFNDTNVSVTIDSLDAVYNQVVQAIADQSFSDGYKASQSGDFESAQTSYSAAMNQYGMIISNTSNSNTINSQYLLSKTLSEACLMASMVKSGNEQTIGNVSSIPLTYLLSLYSFTITNSDLSLLFPETASNYQLTDDDGTTLIWTDDQVKNILRQVALNNELADQGYTYDELFTSGTTLVDTLNDSDMSAAQGFVDTVDAYMDSISEALTTGTIIDGSAAIMNVSATIDSSKKITVKCERMPIAPLVPYYANGPYAASYYGAALLLFQSGDDNVQIGDTIYVPGNDDASAQEMRLYTAGTALATTQLYVDQISNAMKTINSDIAQVTTSSEQSDIISEFDDKVKDKYDKIIAILLDPNSGAVRYYNDNNESSYAKSVQSYAMQLYGDYESSLEGLLVGDPTSTIYSGILHDLNLAYQMQASFTTDQELIDSLHTKIAELFKNAGDACMDYTTIDDAGVTQHYYFQASTYYNEAVAQYSSCGDDASSDDALMLEYAAYAKNGLQKLADYLYTKNQGITYTDIGGNKVTKTFADILSDYNAFTNQFSLDSEVTMAPNELTMYNDITTMILNGIMLIQLAAGGPTLSTDTVNDNDSSSTDSSSQVADSDVGLSEELGIYLEGQNVPIVEGQEEVKDDSDSSSATDDSVDDAFNSARESIGGNSGVSSDDASDDTVTKTTYTLEVNYDNYQKILEFNDTFTSSIGIDGVNYFYNVQDKDTLNELLSTLYSAAGLIYIYDYLGEPTGDSSADKSLDYMNKWETLTQVLEAQITKNQNPASVYVG